MDGSALNIEVTLLRVQEVTLLRARVIAVAADGKICGCGASRGSADIQAWPEVFKA
jgi:hypothetical protein